MKREKLLAVFLETFRYPHLIHLRMVRTCLILSEGPPLFFAVMGVIKKRTVERALEMFLFHFECRQRFLELTTVDHSHASMQLRLRYNKSAWCYSDGRLDLIW